MIGFGDEDKTTDYQLEEIRSLERGKIFEYKLRSYRKKFNNHPPLVFVFFLCTFFFFFFFFFFLNFLHD